MSVIMPMMVAVPLGAGFLLALLPRSMSSACNVLTLTASASVLAGAAALFGYEGCYNMGGWAPPLGINLTIDGFSGILILTAAFLASVVSVYAVRYMTRYTGRMRYCALIMLMLAGINGTLLSGDIFNRFVYAEVAAIASYVLVGFGCGARELKAALKFAILGAIASVVILMGIALLYAVYGTVNIAHLGEKIAGGEQATSFASISFLAALALLAGYGLKSALVPLHTWQPDALRAAPAPVSALISGTLIVTIGVYAMIRTMFAVFGVNAHLGWILMASGMISMIAGAYLSMKQRQMRKLLAYDGISQVGLVICAFGAGGILAASGYSTFAALAFGGAVFHLVNHSVSTSLLFLCAGGLEYGDAAVPRNGNTAKIAGGRIVYTAWLAGALSSAGAPPMAGFFSKLMIIIAFVTAGYYLPAAVAIAAAIITLVTFARFRGSAGDKVRRPIPPLMALPLIALTVLTLAMGLLAWRPLRESVLEPAHRGLAGMEENETFAYDNHRITVNE